MKIETYLTKKSSKEDLYPIISRGKKPAFYCDKYNREGDIITIAWSGAYVGYVQYWNKSIYAKNCFQTKDNLKSLLYLFDFQ